MRKSILIILLVLFVIGLGACASKPEADEAPESGLNIVATIFPEYDFARAVLGESTGIDMLVKPGATVHSYDPSLSDIKKIENADIFLYIGGESDVWADSILESLDTSKIKVIRLMDYLEAVPEEIKEGMQEEAGEEEEAGALDEHIWTSPKNAILLIDVICDAICEKDPANEDTYRANAGQYQDELQKVDDQITEVVGQAKRKKIIVADRFAYRYFADHYGLEYEAAFPGCSDESDAGAATIAHLVRSVEEEAIPYVYYMELSNQNVAAAISEETGAGMLLLNSCENLSKADFDNGATYVSLMQQNVESLRKGLN